MRIFMSRHGESVNNVLNIIGGDCDITNKGILYSHCLSTYFKDSPITVWTSKLKRTIETAKHINGVKIEWDALNEIHSGDFESMILSDIERLYPESYKHRNSNKIYNSYPNGENYKDLQKRVCTVLDKINTNSDDGTLLIVAHQAVCCIIRSYFTKNQIEECINIKTNLHTLYELKNDTFVSVSL